MFDLEQARRDTPGCERVVHLNNAGAALMPRVVLSTVTGHLELEALTGGYEAARAAHDRVEAVYDSTARLIGCSRDEIAIVENATRAWDMAFYSIQLEPGDRILTGKAEYASNVIAFLQAARRAGARVEVVPNDERGQLSVAALADMMDDRVRVVAITHVPTNGGLVNPAEEVGRVVRGSRALYLLDACQSVGQMPVDVGSIGCDLLSATSRKYLRGPRGVGFLYARRELTGELEPPFLDLHAATLVAPDRYEIRDDARRFENWESNLAGKLGLGAAIDYALAWGIDETWERVRALGEVLRERLSAIKGVCVHDLGDIRCGIVSFSLKGVPADDLRRELAAGRFNVNVSRAASTLLDMRDRGLPEVVRASVHYYNSEDEIERFGTAVAAVTA